MKASRSKTEYMCVNEREASGTVRLREAEVKRSIILNMESPQSRAMGGVAKWRKSQCTQGGAGEVSGVICDKTVATKGKGNI